MVYVKNLHIEQYSFCFLSKGKYCNVNVFYCTSTFWPSPPKFYELILPPYWCNCYCRSIYKSQLCYFINRFWCKKFAWLCVRFCRFFFICVVLCLWENIRTFCPLWWRIEWWKLYKEGEIRLEFISRIRVFFVKWVLSTV